MAENTCIFSTTAFGTTVEFHKSEGLSNTSEFAIKINEEFASTVRLTRKRNGNVHVFPTTRGSFAIKAPEEDVKPSDTPDNLLDGISPVAKRQ